MQSLFLFAFLIVCTFDNARAQLSHFSNATLIERYKWEFLDFEYPNEKSKLKDIEDGKFIKENVRPASVTRWKNKIFITTPRWKLGIHLKDDIKL